MHLGRATPGDRPAEFILSFDCEGRWGLEPFGIGCDHITRARLPDVYARLLEILDRHRVPGTFAFVAAFTLSRDQAEEHRELFEGLTWDGRDWFAPFREALRRNGGDGWLCPEALAMVAAAPAHEIASHSFCHLPLSESQVDRQTFDREMEKVRWTEALHGVASQTFVYPQNIIGHADRLSHWGFVAYRPPRPAEERSGTLARLGRYLDEINLWEPSQSSGKAGMPACLPEGRFINYRYGLRRKIPFGVTASKLRHMLDHAIRRGGVLHLYCHPHEFIRGDRQFELLDHLLGLVSERARNGEVRPCTQRQYYEQRLRDAGGCGALPKAACSRT